MMFAELPESVTTIGGLIGIALVLGLQKLITDMRAKPREEAKLVNLIEQSNALNDGNAINREILEQLKVSAEAHSKYAKFGKKQSKKINKKLGLIHDDVLVVKDITVKKGK